MAINAATNWYVRVAGDALNGGGWDPTISGAGTNYADADAAILSLTDFATSGVTTTVTTATGGMTAAMIGNCLRLASGTNATAGYYFITAVTDTNTFEVDRAPCSAAMSGGTGRIGGAFASLWSSLSTSGTVTAPTITSPLAAGHTVWIRGSGSSLPSSADYTQTGYAGYPAGTVASGGVTFRGYNGRPRIDTDGLFLFPATFLVRWMDIVFHVAGNNNTGNPIIYLGSGSSAVNLRIDQNGYDRMGIQGGSIYGCSFINTGSSSAGTATNVAISNPERVCKTSIIGWRGGGILATVYVKRVISHSIIALCRAGTGLTLYSYGELPQTYSQTVEMCTIHGNASHGINFGSDGNPANQTANYASAILHNNIITNNGGYGVTSDTTASSGLNDRYRTFFDYNAVYNNTSGDYNGITAGENDITLSADPFVSAATGDFSLNNTAGGGALLRGAAFPQW